MLPKHSSPFKYIFVVALVVSGVIFGGPQIVESLGYRPINAVGTGRFIVGSTVYDFVPTTCFIADDDFIMSGTGHDGSERFWVSASSVDLDFAVGTKRSTDRPTEDQHWLVNISAPEWTASGGRVRASAPMSDKRDPNSAQVAGVVELSCDERPA